MIYLQIDDQYVNVDQITSVSYANGTTIFLADGRRIKAPSLSVDEVLERIADAVEAAQK